MQVEVELQGVRKAASTPVGIRVHLANTRPEALALGELHHAVHHFLRPVSSW